MFKKRFVSKSVFLRCLFIQIFEYKYEEQLFCDSKTFFFLNQRTIYLMEYLSKLNDKNYIDLWEEVKEHHFKEKIQKASDMHIKYPGNPDTCPHYRIMASFARTQHSRGQTVVD